MCNHSIIMSNITRYPSVMHWEEIEGDSEVEDEAEEDLYEARGRTLCNRFSTSTCDM
jgi:hypothetical protein